MNDKNIIKTIYAISFGIISFFSFIILVLISLYIILQNGLLLDEISVQNVKIKQLYIKWDEKIDLSIKEIDIQKESSSSQSKPDIRQLKKYVDYLATASQWFDTLTIETIKLNNIKASFVYQEKENGYLYAQSPDFLLTTHIYFQGENLKFDIKKFEDHNNSLFLNGSVLLNPNTLSAKSSFKINIHNDLEAELFLSLNKDRLKYKLVNKKDIKNITNILDIFHLPKEVRYWVYDAIEMDHLSIENAIGSIDFKHPENAIKTVHINATVHGLHYKYNPQLDAIHTRETKLEFKDGILYIRPQDAYSYGMFLDKSWLKIDFTQAEELLTLKLLFKGIVNSKMLKILSTYKIDLPFLQRSGQVQTDLTIAVGLRNIDIDAHGTFFTKEANFDFMGLNIDIYDANIVLDNYDVRIDQMKAKYKDIASALVDVKYDAHSAKGIIHFNAKKVKTTGIQLLVKQTPIIIDYHINPNGDSIDIDKTQWITNKEVLHVDKLHIPFDLKKLTIDLPTTFFEIKNVVSGFLTGVIDLKHNEANLLADILQFNYSNIKLMQSNAQIKIHYKEKTSLSLKEKIRLNIANTDLEISNALVEIKNQTISLKHTDINIADTLYSSISAKYNLHDQSSILRAKKIKIVDKKTKKILYKKSRLVFDIDNNKDTLNVSSKEIDTTFTLSKKRWRLDLNSLRSITRNSSYLKSFALTDGSFSIYKNFDEKSIKFQGSIDYKYKILSQNKKPLSRYEIKGKINKKKTYFTINNNLVSVKITDKIDIKIKKAGINISPLLNLIELLSKQNLQSKKRALSIFATDSYLQTESENIILSDKISLQQLNDITTAQLNYKQGSAGFKLENNNFHLYGKNFNDEFMDKLFRLSRFKGGTLDFSLQGTLDKYNGVFYVNKSTIIDYKLLNNVLAFINTVPSLVTFSLPSYSKEGLYVDSAYMRFSAKDGKFDISDFYLDAKEIDILAKGVADIKKNTIDVTLNLKTDLGSSASKIPIVGYILFDKDSISTTMSITGKLTDPTVSSKLAKDIAVAPLNIIKRTLLYPYKLLRSSEGNTTQE